MGMGMFATFLMGFNAALILWNAAQGRMGMVAMNVIAVGLCAYALHRDYKRGYRYEKTQWSRS